MIQMKRLGRGALKCARRSRWNTFGHVTWRIPVDNSSIGGAQKITIRVHFGGVNSQNENRAPRLRRYIWVTSISLLAWMLVSHAFSNCP